MLMTGGITGFNGYATPKTTRMLGEAGSQIRNLSQAAEIRKHAIQAVRQKKQSE